ncbi:Mov34-domain-containing protein, partial [Aureobasidium melanogenum]
VVIDPIQSVKGKVVIDAFRLINPQTLMLGQEPRQTTSNVGHLNKPSIQALIHGLNRHYYSIAVGYLKGRGGGSGNGASSAVAGASNGQMGGEEAMLMNLHKSVWTEALEMPDFKAEGDRTLEKLNKLVSLAEGYEKRVKEETELTKDQLRTRYVGKVDPKKHIETLGQDLLEDNIVSVSRQMIDKEASVPSACRIEAADDDADGMAVDQTA